MDRANFAPSRRTSIFSTAPSAAGSDSSNSSRKAASCPFSDAASIKSTTTHETSDTIIKEGQRKELFCAEVNPFAPETIVLIHPIYTSGIQWERVTYGLSEYHLLIPDLPCHNRSKDVVSRNDFTFELCADRIAELIRDRAHDGRAHLVGASLGGHIAQELAASYPHLVRSVFTTGAFPARGFVKTTVSKNSNIYYPGLWAIVHSPNAIYRAAKLMGDSATPELLEDLKRNLSSRLAKANGRGLQKSAERLRRAGRTGIRMCLIAALAFDSPVELEDGLRLLVDESKSLGGTGEEFAGFALEGGAHAWQLQWPHLFAQAVRCWIEERRMPEELKAISV